MSTLLAVAATNRLALIDQLYNQWHGHYVLVQRIAGVRQWMRPLTQAEAIEYRLQKNETLEVIWQQ
jgi:hypothetical protein